MMLFKTPTFCSCTVANCLAWPFWQSRLTSTIAMLIVLVVEIAAMVDLFVNQDTAKSRAAVNIYWINCVIFFTYCRKRFNNISIVLIEKEAVVF